MKKLKKWLRNAGKRICMISAFIFYRYRRTDMKLGAYVKWCRRRWRASVATINNGESAVRGTVAFVRARVETLSVNIRDFGDPADPVLIVTVKDDLQRMKLLFDHYRRLGISRFAVIDNGSTDGTLEFAKAQPDANVYGVAEKFITGRKEGWVESVISRIGVNRWYIVVDSDELLDYIGSEQHGIRELVAWQMAHGNTCCGGYMLDMYTKEPIFSTECTYDQIPRTYCYFDGTDYRFENLYDPTTRSKIFGGPRTRLMGTYSRMWKNPLFYFNSEDTVILNPHHQYPYNVWNENNFCVVLRHYKFLPADQKTYRNRVALGNFSGGSKSYQLVMQRFDEDKNTTLYYDGSCRYTCSEDLACLPHLKRIDFGSAKASA